MPSRRKNQFLCQMRIEKPDRLLRYEPNRRAARAWALAASTSRFRGEAVVTRDPSRLEEARVTSSTARLNAFWFAADGLANPLIFLTNCRAAIRISSSIAGGSKLNRVLIFLHTSLTSHHRTATARLRVAPCPLFLLVLPTGGDSIGCSPISHDRFFAL